MTDIVLAPWSFELIDLETHLSEIIILYLEGQLEVKYELPPIFASLFLEPGIMNVTHFEILKHSFYDKRASFSNGGVMM